MFFFKDAAIDASTPLIDKYPLYNYQSYILYDDNIANITTIDYLNAISNIFLKFNTLLVKFVDICLLYFNHIHILDLFLDKILRISTHIYQNLFNQLAALFVVISIMSICYQIFIKRKFKIASIKCGSLLIAIISGSIWINSSTQIFKTLNDVSTDIQNLVVSSVTHSVTLPNQITFLRNQFYELALLNPYLAINYGQINVPILGQARVEKMLLLNMNNEQYNSDKASYIQQEISQYHNYYMTPTLFDFKFIVAIISPIITFFLGIPFFIVSIVNFIIDCIFLIIILILPIILILALLDVFRYKLIQISIKIINLFIAKILLSSMSVILNIIIYFAKGIVSNQSGIMSYFLKSMCIISLYYIIWRHRYYFKINSVFLRSGNDRLVRDDNDEK